MTGKKWGYISPLIPNHRPINKEIERNLFKRPKTQSKNISHVCFRLTKNKTLQLKKTSLILKNVIKPFFNNLEWSLRQIFCCKTIYFRVQSQFRFFFYYCPFSLSKQSFLIRRCFFLEPLFYFFFLYCSFLEFRSLETRFHYHTNDVRSYTYLQQCENNWRGG